jgi:hypothetical protein
LKAGRAARLSCTPMLAAFYLVAAPAFASAGVRAPDPAASAPKQVLLAAGDNVGNSAGGGAGDDSGAAAPAPVPDPFLADALKACRDGASGDSGTVARLAADGWGPSVNGDTQTPFYQAFSGEKDFDGVGSADITFSQEVYPTMTEGYCSVSIDTALRHVGITDLAKMADLTGQIVQDDGGVASTWQVKGTPVTTFIQVDQHNQDLYFILDVTTLIQKPAAKLPFVQPDTTDDPNQEPGPQPGDDGPGTTNAND